MTISVTNVQPTEMHLHLFLPDFIGCFQSLDHKQIQGKKVMHLWNCSLGSVRPHLIGPQMIVSKPAPSGGNVEVEHLLL